MMSECDALSSTLNNFQPSYFSVGRILTTTDAIFLEIAFILSDLEKVLLLRTCYLPTASLDARILSFRGS